MFFSKSHVFIHALAYPVGKVLLLVRGTVQGPLEVANIGHGEAQRVQLT